MSKLLLVALLTGVTSVASADPSRVMITMVDQSHTTNLNAETIRNVLATWIATRAVSGHLDVSVISVDVVSTDVQVEVKAQIRIALSDQRGRILCVLSGAAKASISGRTFRARDLPGLRDEALVAATESVLPKLAPHLQQLAPLDLTRWLGSFASIATS